MTSMILLLLAVSFLAGCAVGAFLFLVFGLHSEERRMALTSPPEGRTGASARRLLVTVREIQTPNDTKTPSLTR
jgi:hypothetical protein